MPTGHHIAGQHQVRHAAGEHSVRTGLGVACHKVHDINKGFACGLQPFGNRHGIRCAALQQFGFGCLDLRCQGLARLTTIARGLATHEVIGLDGGGAFVNRQDFRVTVELGYASFFDETHATVHLNRHRRHFQAHLGAVALDQGHHEFVEGVVDLAHLGVRVVVRGVVGRCGDTGHRPAAFYIGTHGHEHAAHIGVVDDGRTSLDGTIHRTALHTFA